MADKKARKHKPDVFTIRELAEEFKRDYLPKKKESTRNSYNSRVNKIADKFGSISIDELTGWDITRWLKKIAKKHPVNANRLQAIFSKMYLFANDPDQGIHPNTR